MRLDGRYIYGNDNRLVAVFDAANGRLRIVRRRRIPNSILHELGLNDLIEQNRANDRRHEANRNRHVSAVSISSSSGNNVSRRRNRSEPIKYTLGFELEYTDGAYDRDILARRITERGVKCSSQNYNHRTPRNWKLVHDGSLRGRNTGELVSPVFNNRNFEEKIAAITEAIDGLCEIDPANKSAGFHIHIKPKNGEFTDEDIRDIYTAYQNNEELIDSFMSRSRRGSGGQWCRSLSDLNIDYLLSMERRYLNPRHAYRYHKINFMQAVAERGSGTIEFRHHQGTTNKEKIINWAKFVMAFVENAKNLGTYDTLEELLDAMNLEEDVKNFFIARKAKLN